MSNWTMVPGKNWPGYGKICPWGRENRLSPGIKCPQPWSGTYFPSMICPGHALLGKKVWTIKTGEKMSCPEIVGDQ